MDFIPFAQWHKNLKNTQFLFIAGPCSAESKWQVIQTAQALDRLPQVKVFRAGIWKPRTSPNSFQGIGKPALKWLKAVKDSTNLLTATEVANPKHLEQALKSKAVDIIWLGARTVTNPFSVQELADALRGIDLPVMVKNPLHPDIKLWIGAIERLYKAGIKKIAAIHRGFYPFENHYLRNIPKWEIPIELKTTFPDLPIITDPSHIAGDKKFIFEISQKALDLNFNGLMIEVHINPSKALSDAKQQLTPAEFAKLLANLKFKTNSFGPDFLDKLEYYRNQIDSIDYQILELLAKRMNIVRNIGIYKNQHNISILQLERWQKILSTRINFGTKLGLKKQFIKKLISLIHKESIDIQTQIKNNHENKS
jgi:chorismate mutase